ncbi:hypothetical protein EMCRGX_G033441 [Ephydatia muelleri]
MSLCMRSLIHVVPKFIKPRPIPFALTAAVEQELHRLEERGVLRRITRSSWAAPIVVVPKKDGRVQLCGDYKITFDQYLEVDCYPLPKSNELFATLAGGQKFSKIDLSQAYQQLALEEELVIPMASSTTTAKTLRHCDCYLHPMVCQTSWSLEFVSKDFAEFMAGNAVKHIHVAPYHPASNGLAELFVQLFKKAISAKRNDGLSQTASDCSVYSIAFATDVVYGSNPASHQYGQTKLRLHFLECSSREQIAPFPSKSIKYGKPNQSTYIFSAHVECQLKQMSTWPNVPYLKSGITSPGNIFLMQYLKIQIVTGNAPCASKDELKGQGIFMHIHNS